MKLAVNNAENMFLPWSENFKEVNMVLELPKEIKDAKSVPMVSKLILNIGLKKKMLQIVEILFR